MWYKENNSCYLKHMDRNNYMCVCIIEVPDVSGELPTFYRVEEYYDIKASTFEYAMDIVCESDDFYWEECDTIEEAKKLVLDRFNLNMLGATG